MTYLSMTSLEMIGVLAFLIFGLFTTFKAIKAGLRFLYLNSNRSVHYHLKNIEPHFYLENRKNFNQEDSQVVPASVMFTFWSCCDVLNLYLLVIYLTTVVGR